MIRVYTILVLYLVTPIAITYSFERWSPFRKIGTVVLAYAIGIVLALTGACRFEGEAAIMFAKWQTMIMNVAVPIAIPLMLFNCDFRLWTKALPKTIYSLVGGLVAIVIAVVSGFWVFRQQGIPNLPDVAAMLTGIYTGGTMNFNALGASLGVNPSLMAIVLAFQMLITTPYLFFIIAGGYRLFRRLLPFADQDTQTSEAALMQPADEENYSGLLSRNNWPGMLAGLGLSVLCLAIGAGIAWLLTGTLNELIIILTITTLAIAASFSDRVRHLPKTFEMGMLFILLFSVVVASLFDIHGVNSSSMMIGAFVLYVVLVGCTIHLIFCRLAKVDGDLFTVSQVALLCSPPFVPPVVGAMGNHKVLLSGIVIGLVGYAVGTYLGVLINLILLAL